MGNAKGLIDMTYIRTKDGRILDLSWFSSVMEITKESILKEADTIEELCDEFVIDEQGIIVPYSVKSNGEVFWKYKFDDSIPCDSFSLKSIEDVVYGAIWTDKGLIYVAKMNEEGELELL